MSQKVIVNSDETIVCPKCSEKFPLDKGITRQTMEKYENEYEEEFEKRKAEITEEIRKSEEKKAKKEFDEKQSELQEQLKASEEAREKAETAANKALEDTRTKLSEEFEEERKTLIQDLEQKDSAIKTFRANEMALRKEKLAIEEAKANLELDVQRRLDEERRAIQEQTVKTEGEKYRLREAEYKKKLDDAQKANEELSRKLEQGSQQLQGEVLELEIETILRANFPHDKIEPVKKGQRGADILHTVYTPSGQRCGTIIWEAKRAENWSDKWIQKLKDDQLESKAEIAVIVTTSMPLGIEEPFMQHEGVWITKDFIVKPVAQSLRIMLIEANNLKIVNTGKNEKMEALYNYLCSPQFSQRIRAVVDTFMGMKRDLDQEKNAFMKIWKKREAQIERVATNMTGMVGELEAISQESFKQLENIEQLSLPKADIIGEEG